MTASELSQHVSEFHGNLEAGEGAKLIDEHKNMLTDISTLKQNSTLVVELVAGKEIIDPFTKRPTGDREPGIAHRVEALEYASNGGRGFSVRNRDKLIIGAIASVPSVGTLFIAFLAIGGG